MKICLAGSYAITAENRKQFEKCPFMLESFYYVKEWQIPLIKKAELFLLDSGAFTFMNNTKKGNIDWKNYIDKYIDFINTYEIKHFFELDIDVIVGYEKVKEIRKYIEAKTQKKCIPVWHKARGKDEFLKLCEEYDYVAIGGIVTKEITQSEYKFFPWFINEAHKRGAKIHGLGFTNLKSLKKYHFDSVDSTSWKSGNRFGSLYIYNNGELKQIKKPDDKRMVTGNKYSYVEGFVLDEWLKFQRYASKHL